MEKYTNDIGHHYYKGVEPDTAFEIMDFCEVEDCIGSDNQWALHTNLGSLTVLDRMTGFIGGIRDTETGYRDKNGKFWLASGMVDVRYSGAKTMQEAIDWVKNRANTCVGV